MLTTHEIPASFLFIDNNDNEYRFYHPTTGHPIQVAADLWAMHSAITSTNSREFVKNFFHINAARGWVKNFSEPKGKLYIYSLDYTGQISVNYQRCCLSDPCFPQNTIASECVTLFEGKWYNFVNQHVDRARKLYPFQTHPQLFNEKVMTLPEAQAYVEGVKTKALKPFGNQSYEDQVEFMQPQITLIALEHMIVTQRMSAYDEKNNFYKEDTIIVSWDIDDVKQINPRVSVDEAREILQEFKARNDEVMDVAWQILETICYEHDPDYALGSKIYLKD